MHVSPTTTVARNQGLDLLRTFAIVSVVLFHMSFHNDLVARWGAPLVSGGWAGVDLFFVLSGWLIGGLYWREFVTFGDVRIPRFMGRRLLRTLPPYYCALVLTWLAVYLFQPERNVWRSTYLVFLQNIVGDMPFFHVSWSLCIEEHFYVLMPSLLAVWYLWYRMPVVPLLLGLACVPLGLRLTLGPPSEEFDGHFFVHETYLRCEGLLLGVCASYVARCHKSQFQRLEQLSPVLLIPAVAYVVASPLLPYWWTYKFGYSILAVCFTIMLVAAQTGRVTLLPSRLNYAIAISSYSIYLTHMLGIHLGEVIARRTLPSSDAWEAFCMVAIIFLLGGAFYKAVERPAILLRDRVLKDRSKLAKLAAPPAPT